VGVDVGALQLTKLGDPHARGIEGGEDRARLEGAWSQPQRLDLVATEENWELRWLFGIGNVVCHPGTAQGGLVEKA